MVLNRVAASVRVLASASLIGFAAPAFAVTAVSGTVQISPRVGFLTATPSVNVQGGGSQTVTGLPTSLGLNGMSIVQADNSSIVADGYARANWLSASQGTIDTFMRWSFGIAQGTGGGFADFTSDPKNWSYTFTTTGASTSLTFGYNVLGSGSTFGLQGWDLFLGDDQLSFIKNTSNPTTAGSAVFAIGGPGTYTLSLRNNGNIGTGDLNDYTGQVAGQFTWELSERTTGAVPEPATWAMMILGFGLIGSTMRRRRTSVHFA